MVVGMKEHTAKTRVAKCCELSRSFPPQQPNLGAPAQKSVPQSTRCLYTPEHPHGVKGLCTPFKVNAAQGDASTRGGSCSSASGAGWAGAGEARCWPSAGCGPSRPSSHRALRRDAAARQVWTCQSSPACPCLQAQPTVGVTIAMMLSCSAQKTAPKLNIFVILNC